MILEEKRIVNAIEYLQKQGKSEYLKEVPFKGLLTAALGKHVSKERSKKDYYSSCCCFHFRKCRVIKASRVDKLVHDMPMFEEFGSFCVNSHQFNIVVEKD